MKAKFRGSVSHGRYRWQRAGHLCHLVELHSHGFYDPFADDVDGLVARFAKLAHDDDINREDVLEFANQYGSLTGQCEPLEIWRTEVASIARCMDSLPADTVLELAGTQLHDCEIQFRQGHKETKGRQRAKITPPGCYVITSTLQQAIWAQLIMAVLEGHEFADCEMCGRPMRAKKRRLYCSDSCRVRQYNFRKKEAMRLYYSGATSEQVVERLKLDEDIFMGWKEEWNQ